MQGQVLHGIPPNAAIELGEVTPPGQGQAYGFLFDDRPYNPGHKEWKTDTSSLVHDFPAVSGAVSSLVFDGLDCGET